MLAGTIRISHSLFLLSFLLAGCTQSPVSWWKSLNKKAEHMAELEARYEALRREHEALQKEFYRLEHEHAELTAKLRSQETASESLSATGSRLGRAPASIAYRAPAGLNTEALLALGYEHLREKRFAEAAVTFETLLNQPESAALQGASAYYSAGVAWFKINNFRKAREAFEAAKAHADGEERERVRKKVELWMRVIDRKLASDGGRLGG